MKILGFDTATRATTVALVDTDSDEVLERRDDPPAGARPRHTTRLMSLVVDVLGAAEVSWADIDRIAVGVGPGTFTGLRIGVATAQALARARDIEVVGVSTLHALARGTIGDVATGNEAVGGVATGNEAVGGVATGNEAVGGVATGNDAVLAIIDARRREVFAAGWAAADLTRSDATPLLHPRALSPEALAQTIRVDGPAWLAVGDGAVEFREALEHAGARIPEPESRLHRVSAVEHCRLALALRPEPPEGIQPEYLRLPDAEINLRTARQQ